ncbi:hypothetical protein [Jiangella asiatica]|uniref:Uncharacterized protein n=1 Tax=Jiangella asiatica TaxID=2530372 RepID=A0A4R5CN46_9ACTN|nr:hypothetical protein [Jiangella asiatica]TDE01819.1 hypothetical protein E1269_22695 [Jiangella asiatica]
MKTTSLRRAAALGLATAALLAGGLGCPAQAEPLSVTDTPDGTVSTIELFGFAQIDDCGDTSLRAYPNG